jgi:dTDP-4-dehydrorhamnose reductase
MRVLLTGASGLLGSYLLDHLDRADIDPVLWMGSRDVDFSVPEQVVAAFRRARPDLILHTAAMAKVADCDRHPERAERVNVGGTRLLAELAGEAGARLVHTSTDLVFDGERGWYREGDSPSPLSVYGRTKLAAEEAVLAGSGNVVVRLSLLFGPARTRNRGSFFDQMLSALQSGKPVSLFADEWRTPLGLRPAAAALVRVAVSAVSGLLHLGGPERMSRLEMGQRLAAFLRLDPSGIVVSKRDNVPAPAPRPRDCSLDSSRWRHSFPNEPWPTWEEVLTDYRERGEI